MLQGVIVAMCLGPAPLHTAAVMAPPDTLVAQGAERCVLPGRPGVVWHPVLGEALTPIPCPQAAANAWLYVLPFLLSGGHEVEER